MRDCQQNHSINIIMPFSREVLVHKSHALHVMLIFHQGTMRCSEPAKSTKVTQPSMSPVAMKMRHSLGDCCGIWLHDVMWLGDVVMVRLSRTCLHFSLRHFWPNTSGDARLWVLDTDLLATLRISNWLHAHENGQFDASSLASHAWEREDWSWTPVAAVALNLPPAQKWKLQKSVIQPCSVECLWAEFVPHCKDFNRELIRTWSIKSVCITLQNIWCKREVINDHNKQTPNSLRHAVIKWPARSMSANNSNELDTSSWRWF